MAHEAWTPRFHFAGASPGRFTCGLVVQGRVLASFDGRERSIPAGHAICWDGRARILRPDPDAPPELWLVTVASRRLARLAARCLGCSAGGVPLAAPAPVQRQLAEMHAEAATDGRYRAEILLARVPELLWRMRAARAADNPADDRDSAAHHRFGHCIRTAERQFHTLRTVAALAEAAGIGSAHCCRLFRRFGGETPLQLLTRLRMAAAAEELSRGLSVTAVAAAFGYPDPPTFSKAFKRWAGHAPSAQAAGDGPP